MTNKYIKVGNKKAGDFIIANGGTLSAVKTKNKYACCSLCSKTPISSIQVKYVSGGKFNGMSGS